MPSNKKSRKKQKGKGKLKKEARKEALAAEKAKRALVNAARVDASGSPHNVLAQFAPFAKYDRNELDLVIEFAAPSAISTEDMDWMLALTRANMEEMYVDGGWGWNDTEKRRELMDDEARHLLVRRRAPTAATGDESKDDAKAEAGAGAGAGAGATSGELVAFAHFRFLLEDEYPVLYVQEIQLTEPVQRKGLGKHMMQTLELIARKQGMQFVMLTVFKANQVAVSFYMQKLHYTIDDSSPDMHYADGEHSYLILSKCIDPVLAKEIKAAQAAGQQEEAATAAHLLAAASIA